MILNKYVLVGVLLISGFLSHAENQQFVISTQKSFLRDKPSFLGKSIGPANYGTKITVLKRAGGWCQIKLNSQIGWVHQSSVQDSYYILKDIGRGEAASKGTYKDEVVSAGKGFSPEYESMMKSQNANLKYSTVDQIETYKISVESLVKFGINGGLNSEILK